MKTRFAIVLGVSAAACALGVSERSAVACGGCFHPPTQNVSDITDERMLLSVSPQQTTLYDQIRYSGNPASFAWVLPIKGTVDVGLSADVLFASMDAVTATQIQAPNISCPPPPSDCTGGGGANSAFAGAPAADGANGGVTVTKQQNVGPYETVQLHATDSSALEGWLAQNAFVIPDDVKPVIAAYVSEGFDFLAMKLLPNQGVQSMRPVRVTTGGASMSLPLRMASIGTGVSVGITIWVVADGRYEPQNFPSYHIDDADLVWDFKTSSSNYTTLRAQNEARLGGRGWEIESSIDLNEQLIENVILSGGVYYGGNYGPGAAGGATSNAADDYLPVPAAVAGDGGANADGGASGDGGETADQVRADDIAHLFEGMAGPNVRVTRMRSDIAHAAMTTDFVVKASDDPSELSNIRQVKKSVNLSCPVYVGCAVVGTASPEEAARQNESGSGCGTTGRRAGSPLNVGAAAVIGLGLTLLRLARRKKR